VSGLRMWSLFLWSLFWSAALFAAGFASYVVLERQRRELGGGGGRGGGPKTKSSSKVYKRWMDDPSGLSETNSTTGGLVTA
jgi:hypothetical protein